jgi:hypothetical protein
MMTTIAQIPIAAATETHCSRNLKAKEAFDEEDVVYAMAGSVEILLPTEPQWHNEIGRGYEVRVHFGGRINAS